MIDAYKKLARNWLKKTGDTMIGGDLTLFRDPTLDLHAVDKRYVDQHSNTALPAVISGREYYPSWGATVSSILWLAVDVGRAIIAPMYLETTGSYSRLRTRCSVGANSAFRLGIYYLDPNTWLPTQLALDAGAVSWTGVGGDRTLAISFTPTQRSCGIAAFYDTRSDSTNVNMPSLVVQQGGFWPGGYDPSSASLSNPIPYRLTSTGNPSGAMPAANTYSWVVAADNLTDQPLIGVQRA